jgi:hypothetical protein
MSYATVYAPRKENEHMIRSYALFNLNKYISILLKYLQ